MTRSASTAGRGTPEERNRRLGVIYNPWSGRRVARRGLRLPGGIPVCPVRRPVEVGEALRRLAGENVGLLAVAGGDGTVQAVLTHLMAGSGFDRMPVLALIPTGSTNMTAGDVGSVGARRGNWDRLAQWAREPRTGGGRLVTRPVLRVRPHPGAAAQCGMFFGVAVACRAAAYTQERLHRLGLRGALGSGIVFMRFLAAIARRDRRIVAPVRVRVCDDRGHALSMDAKMLLVSTLHRLVLGTRPFWGNRDDGRIGWTAIEEGARAFMLNLPAVCRGRPAMAGRTAQGYHSHNAERLEISFDGSYVLDGEFHQARSAGGPVTLACAGQASFLTL